MLVITRGYILEMISPYSTVGDLYVFRSLQGEAPYLKISCVS